MLGQFKLLGSPRAKIENAIWPLFGPSTNSFHPLFIMCYLQAPIMDESKDQCVGFSDMQGWGYAPMSFNLPEVFTRTDSGHY